MMDMMSQWSEQLSSVMAAGSTSGTSWLADVDTTSEEELVKLLDGIGQDGWSLACQVEKKDLSMYTRYDAEGALVIAADVDYECPPSSLIAVAREFDLLETWNEYMSCTRVLKVPSLLSICAYQEL